MANEVELTINSNDYADYWESIIITEKLNDVTDVSLELYASQTNYRDDINNGKTVVVGWNDGSSHNLFQGTLTDVNITSDDLIRTKVQDDGTWALIGWNTLNFDYVIGDAVSTETMVSELCSEGLDGSPPWVTQPSTNTNYGNIAFRAQNTDRLSALKRLSEHIGYDWWISWAAGTPYFNIDTAKGSTDDGTCSGYTDTDELKETGKTWDDTGSGEWADYKVVTTGGTGAGQVRDISSNTADTLTVSAVWSTNPDATTTYDIVKQVFFTYGANQNVLDVTRKRDTSRVKNVVYVLGFGDGDPTSGTGQIISDGSHVDAGSVSSWGRHEIRHVDRSIITEAEANRLAAQTLATFKDPINMFTLIVDDTELILPSQVEVGDTIMIRDNNIFFAAEGTYNAYRVLERTLNFTPGAREVRLLCASKNWDLVNDLSRMFNLIEEQSRYNLINETTTAFLDNAGTASFLNNITTGAFLNNTGTDDFLDDATTDTFLNNNTTGAFLNNTSTGAFLDNTGTGSFLNNTTTGNFIDSTLAQSYVRDVTGGTGVVDSGQNIQATDNSHASSTETSTSAGGSSVSAGVTNAIGEDNISSGWGDIWTIWSGSGFGSHTQQFLVHLALFNSDQQGALRTGRIRLEFYSGGGSIYYPSEAGAYLLNVSNTNDNYNEIVLMGTDDAYGYEIRVQGQWTDALGYDYFYGYGYYQHSGLHAHDIDATAVGVLVDNASIPLRQETPGVADIDVTLDTNTSNVANAIYGTSTSPATTSASTGTATNSTSTDTATTSALTGTATTSTSTGSATTSVNTASATNSILTGNATTSTSTGSATTSTSTDTGVKTATG